MYSTRSQPKRWPRPCKIDLQVRTGAKQAPTMIDRRKCGTHVDQCRSGPLIKMACTAGHPTMNAAHFALERAAWQPILFNTPNRAAIASCNASWPCHPLRVRVHRNHAFEPVSSICAAYAAWNRIHFDWRIGSYDDSLSFGLEDRGEIELVWFDSERVQKLADGELAEWLLERLQKLRS